MILAQHETGQMPSQHLREEPPCGPSAPRGMWAADHKRAPPLQEQQSEEVHTRLQFSCCLPTPNLHPQ